MAQGVDDVSGDGDHRARTGAVEVTPGQADEHQTPRHWGLFHRPGREQSTQPTRTDAGVSQVVDVHTVHPHLTTVSGHAGSRVELRGQRDDARRACHEMIDVLAAQGHSMQRMPLARQCVQLTADSPYCLVT